MSWRATARREGRDLRAATAVRALLAIATLTGAAAVAVPATALGADLGAEAALPFLVVPLKLVIGLTGLLLGHAAVAGPRSGGQLKLALALPVDRRAFVLGTFVGRAAATLSAAALAILGAGAAMYALFGALPVRGLAGFAGLLGLFGLSVTAIGVGLSASVGSRGAAAVAAVGAFVLFQFFWGVVPAGVHYLLEGSLPGATVPAWLVLIERAQPFAALEAAAELAVQESGRTVRLSGSGAAAGAGGSAAGADRLAGAPPWYLDPAVAVGILVAWAVVPLAIGAERFRRADL